MKKFVGDFASEKLNKLAERIKIYREHPTEEQRAEIQTAISFYGDEYLRMKLEKAIEL